MSPDKVQTEILDNPALVKKADSIAALAEAAGLPADALADTVQRFNRFVDQGNDTDFGRIAPGMSGAAAVAHPQAALLCRAALSDDAQEHGRARHRSRHPCARRRRPGHPRFVRRRRSDGRGRHQWQLRGLRNVPRAVGAHRPRGRTQRGGAGAGWQCRAARVHGGPAAATEGRSSDPAPAQAIDLPALVGQQRPGYWHFNVSHALVLERGDACATCHKDPWQPGPAVSAGSASCSSTPARAVTEP